MGTVKGIRAKLLVSLIVFMIIFSNCGFTLSAIATSDEFQVITNGFFRKDEIKFNAYFEDENGNQTTEMTENVNQKVKLILDILPQVEGYLKSANLKAVSENNSDVNFKITNVSYYQEENDLLDAKPSVNLEVNNEENVEEKTEEITVENTVTEDVSTTEETVVENTTNQTESSAVSENVTDQTESSALSENVTENTLTAENLVSDELSASKVADTNTVSGTSNTTNETVVDEVSNVAENTVANNVTNSSVNNEVVEESREVETTDSEEAIPEDGINEEDVLIDEEKVIEEKTEEVTAEEDLTYDMKVVSDNEIELRNIIKDTKIVLELEYKMDEKLNIEDLMKSIHLQLSGTYINSDLEEVKVAKEAVVTLGWEYTKDVELKSEYTKFSPFEVGEIKGTIVENKISVKREIADEKYLPIKNTSIEVGVPEVNGKKPIEINVICEKLLATRGEDTGYTTFIKDNWSYDAGTGKIQISVENENLVYTSGLDEYVIIYRYEDKIDAGNSDLGKNVKLTIEEYSAENNIITKEINETQNIKVDVGELITYNISTTEDKINKAKIYANYNNETPIYETEYTNQVNVNILTSDILEELKINCNQEAYKDVNGFEFTAEGIEYRRVKFSFSEITNLLVNGGEIVITNEAGEILYTLNKDVIKSEEDCEINLNGQTGIIIYARNIAKNGNLNFELVKVIKGCNYEKSAFKNFTSIESRITAEVKYQKIEERLSLPTIGTAKQFEEASTYATLSINKESLSTTKSNENVEIKIELNNDKENSDLYINPAFEVVFPKYVKEVTIQNANVLYENGLKIGRIDTYTENDIVRIRVELEGIQKTFSESSITNGTNIIINANIKVDEYTPKKEDQIKLYYCNEGVSTYQSQTKWSISKNIPNNILKTTNGFDVAIIKYQAPNGLIAINGIVNYDGNLSEVKSVKQGEVKEQIEINSTAKIMTMELLALNNTDNKCTDIVLLGRIPFAGVKDVITNEDLGTTTNTVMKDLIKEDIQNTNTVDIYYSNNAEATKELDNIGNGWTKEVTDISQVKSFLIVVKGSLEAGQVLRYTYDFEVPANLPYETNIEGSFGAFYNNNTDVAVVYESSVADTVGLVTEAGPKLEATLSVDVGDGTEVGECRFLNYTVKVKNIGSVIATGVTVTNPIPNNTLLYQYDTSDLGLGNNNWVEAENPKDPTWTIETLNPDEEKEFNFMVKTARLQDEDEVIVKSKAKVTASNLGIEIESNETSNKVEPRNFDLMINTDTLGKLEVGKNIQYKTIAINISENDLENVKIECKIPKELKYNETYIAVGEDSIVDKEKITFDETTNTVTVIVDKVAKDDFINIKFGTTVAKGSEDILAGYVSFFTEDGTEERTSVVTTEVIGPILKVEQVTNAESVLEGQNVEFAILIENIGTADATELKINDIISTYLEDVTVRFSGNTNTNVGLKDGNLDCALTTLPAGSKLVITINGIVSNLPENTDEIKITNQATISGAYIEDITTNLSEIIVKRNPDKVEEEKPEDPKFDNVVNQDDNNSENGNTNSDGNNNQQTNNDTQNNSNNVNNNNSNNNASSNNSSSNNSSNSSSNNSNSGNSSNNAINNSSNNNANTINEKKAIYSISGKAWIDANKNGKFDSEEKRMPTVKVQLYKNSSMIKAVTTDGNGEYKFTDLEAGNYIITFVYNSEKYTVTTYKLKEATDEYDSDALEVKDRGATTNSIVITDSDVSNIDVGLKLKDTFDLSIEKYLTKVKVTTQKSTKEYNFNKDKLSKVEIRSKEIEGAKVDLEYIIEVENTGDVQGNALKIVDQLPEDMTFDADINEGWYLGSDGSVYNETLKDTVIEPGEKLELKLTLTKVMTEENTGIAINKVILQGTSNILSLNEELENNVSTNEIMILISTGGSTMAILVSIAGIIIFLFMYLNRDKLHISFDKTYKNKVNRKNKIKKVYK